MCCLVFEVVILVVSIWIWYLVVGLNCYLCLRLFSVFGFGIIVVNCVWCFCLFVLTGVVHL